MQLSCETAPKSHIKHRVASLSCVLSYNTFIYFEAQHLKKIHVLISILQILKESYYGHFAAKYK